MSMQAKATFEIEHWDETPLKDSGEGPRLTRAVVTKTYEGDIRGESRLEYLMMHRDDGTAEFVGLERVTGSLGGRSGSFVLRHIGTFEEGIARAVLKVVDESGTKALAGLRGEGQFESGHRREYPLTLDYELP